METVVEEKPLSVNDMTKLATRSLYDVQKLRIQIELRMARLVRDGIMTEAQANHHYELPLQLFTQAEEHLVKELWYQVRDMPIVGEYLSKIKGIGPRLSGLLIANIAPISRFDTISKLWAYAGLHVTDGRAAKRAKGAKANWNDELKTTAWKIAGSFVKIADSPYRKLYDDYKARIVQRTIDAGQVVWGIKDSGKVYAVHFTGEPPAEIPKKDKIEWSLGRINNMAMRYIAKRLLSHLWLVWRKIEGLEIRQPYVQEKMGHTTIDDPWDYVQND